MARFAVLALALARMFASLASAQEVVAKKYEPPVKITATATKIDAEGKQKVTITITMEKGIEVFANPVKNEDFESAAARVSISAKSKPVSVRMNFPAGEKRGEKIVGDYYVYTRPVAIEAFVERAANDASPLEVTVYCQFFNWVQLRCYPPLTRKFTLP